MWPAGVISLANCPSRALAGISAILLKPEARFRLYSALSMMVTRGGGGARSAFIHDANGRGPRVLSHASLRMHALTVHPSARRSTRYACTHRSPMYVSPSMRCIHSRCEWPRLVLACTPRPSMHVSPLMRAAAYSTHALSLPSYALCCRFTAASSPIR